MPRMHKGPQSLQEVVNVGKIITLANSEFINLKNASGLDTGFFGNSSGGDGQIRLGNAAGANRVIFDGGFVARFQMGVNAGSTATIDASVILECNSTSKGFLPPRLTTIQKNAIAAPATGLVVFDTNLAKLCVYTGAAWETITSA